MEVGAGLSPSDMRPAIWSIPSTVEASSSWFLGEKASIDGGTTQIRPASSPSQANSRLENT